MKVGRAINLVIKSVYGSSQFEELKSAVHDTLKHRSRITRLEMEDVINFYEEVLYYST